MMLNDVERLKSRVVPNQPFSLSDPHAQVDKSWFI